MKSTQKTCIPLEIIKIFLKTLPKQIFTLSVCRHVGACKKQLFQMNENTLKTLLYGPKPPIANVKYYLLDESIDTSSIFR